MKLALVEVVKSISIATAQLRRWRSDALKIKIPRNRGIFLFVKRLPYLGNFGSLP
jgi:hypothetical protein